MKQEVAQIATEGVQTFHAEALEMNPQEMLLLGREVLRHDAEGVERF